MRKTVQGSLAKKASQPASQPLPPAAAPPPNTQIFQPLASPLFQQPAAAVSKQLNAASFQPLAPPLSQLLGAAASDTYSPSAPSLSQLPASAIQAQQASDTYSPSAPPLSQLPASIRAPQVLAPLRALSIKKISESEFSHASAPSPSQSASRVSNLSSSDTFESSAAPSRSRPNIQPISVEETTTSPKVSHQQHDQLTAYCNQSLHAFLHQIAFRKCAISETAYAWYTYMHTWMHACMEVCHLQNCQCLVIHAYMHKWKYAISDDLTKLLIIVPFTYYSYIAL
jgi:hypothetical protein